MGFIIDHWDFTRSPAQRTTLSPSFAQETSIQAPSLQKHAIQSDHWYHCDRQHPDIRQWLLENHIPPSTVKHLLASESRPSFHQYDDHHFMLILRGMNMNKDAAPEDMLSIRILFYHGALISTQKVSSHAIQHIQRKLLQQQGPKQLSDLMIQIIEELNGNIDRHLESVENRLNELTLENQQQNVIPVQKTLLRVKRFIRPQQYALRDLAESGVTLLTHHTHQLHYSLNNITRINETMDFYLDELELLKEEWHQHHEETVSKNSYLFTVVATIFLPLSFLTGLLGVNIGGIPGTESPMAFVWFCGLLLALCAIEWWILRRLRFVG